ncbi:MAG TPA: hypothetical protein VF669_13665 [Tepidisphaeraceae bacterium]
MNKSPGKSRVGLFLKAETIPMQPMMNIGTPNSPAPTPKTPTAIANTGRPVRPLGDA